MKLHVFKYFITYIQFVKLSLIKIIINNSRRNKKNYAVLKNKFIYRLKWI